MLSVGLAFLSMEFMWSPTTRQSTPRKQLDKRKPADEVSPANWNSSLSLWLLLVATTMFSMSWRL